MTANKSTPAREKSEVEACNRITTIGALAASEHDIHTRGATARFSTTHAGKVDAEVFTDRGVWLAVESEETTRASTAVKITADTARQLAELLRAAADDVDTTGD